MLTFDESAHRYYWNGKPVPGVTSVLTQLVDYSRIPPETLERARQEGAAIHKMVELYEKDDLESIPDWLLPRMHAYRKFKADSGFVVWKSEAQVYHSSYKYAGTFDLSGKLYGKNALVDIKRSFAAGAVIGCQLAAYAEADSMVIGARFALQLNDDGNYKLEEFKDKSDFQTFLAALHLYKWRLNHGRSDADSDFV